jgi:hypothetical protein
MSEEDDTMRYLNALPIRCEDAAKHLCSQLCNWVGGWWGYDETGDGDFIIGTTAKFTKSLQNSAYYFIRGYLAAKED